MKKIININLSGRVIPIEDSAYEKLQSYIESLRRYFALEDGRDEIINDIESRIAELMSEKVRKGAACVTDSDIEEIIASMGRPEDFDADAQEPSGATSGQQKSTDAGYSSTRTRKKLYRDANDKFLGGVCSGIANYLNTDPAIVRILFAIITFGGFGLGIPIYILLWIFIPKADLEDGYSGKRLYRNPEDKVVGGVAGGLAAYFNTRSSTIRLIFAAPMVLSFLFGILNGFTWRYDFEIFPNIIFGSLSGTFILAYIILWIVLPEARSTYEKMEMRGEKVDVNTIRQNVREGIGSTKERMKEWSEEVKESAQNLGSKAKEFANTKGKTFAREVNETARNSGRGLGHAIGVLFKAFFLFIAGSIAFGLFVAVMALIGAGIAWWPINDFLWTSKWQQAYAWGTLIFFFLVPLAGFMIWLIRRIIGVRSRRSYLGWTFGFLWTIGWVCAILLVASVSKDFREYKSGQPVEVASPMPANDKLIMVVSQPKLQYTGNFSWIDDDAEGWDLSGDTGRLSTVKLTFQKSDDSAYHVVLKKYSYGRTVGDAINRAERIQYSVTATDSVLDLGNGYTIDKQSKFRGQQVEIVTYIPVGKKIRFDPTILERLNPSDFKFRKSRHYKTVVNGRVRYRYSYDEDHFPYSTDVDYTMGNDGKLKDPEGKNASDYDAYRYQEVQTVNSDGRDTITAPSLEEQRKKVRDEERKLKEMEDEQKRKDREQQRSSGKLEGIDDKEVWASRSKASMFSLVETFF